MLTSKPNVQEKAVRQARLRHLSAFSKTVPHNFSSYNVFCLNSVIRSIPDRERNKDVMAPSALPAEVATLVTEALCMLLAAGWRLCSGCVQREPSALPRSMASVFPLVPTLCYQIF